MFNFSKRVFSARETDFIFKQLEEASDQGFLSRRSERNPYLIASYCGVEEAGISPKWNVKIYSFNKARAGHSIVCIDSEVLQKLVEADYESFVPPDLQVLRVDDAGWGFPLCGVMVGVTDEVEVLTDVVPVGYFRSDTETNFGTRLYLDKYTELALDLIDKFEALPDTHRIEICTGFINRPVKERLRELRFDVRVVEVKGLLQDELEKRYKEYVTREVGEDLYFDPKEIGKSSIPKHYSACVDFGRKRCPELLKNGWKALAGY